MESGDFKEQLESDIEYANSPAYDIRVECDEEFGSIAVSLFSKKVTDEFYVEFRMSSIVQFLGWKAYSRTSGVLTELSSDYIKFSDNEEIESGLYRVRVKFLKAVSGIVIKPNCQILPKVSEVLPEFYDFGVDQDSTIKIKFNKCVNPDTFGDFSGIKIKSGSENLRDYYGTPYFSDDNKTINIPTVKTKDIVTSGTKDIFVSFEFAESPLDADGMKIDFGETHRFRVNTHKDDVKPVLSAVNLWSDENKTRELTSKSFENWTSDSDFTCNHIKNTFYFELSGTDEGSGIAQASVTESHIKYASGADGNSARTSVVSLSEKDGKFYAPYTLQLAGEGIIKLEFKAVDYSENESDESVVYYVIKDTSINDSVIKFEGFSQSYSADEGYFKEYSDSDFAALGRKVSADGMDTVTLVLADSSKDTFYSGHSSEFDIEAYWGYSEDSITNTVAKTQVSGKNQVSFVRNAEKIAYVKITVRDDVGNEKSIVRSVPPVLDFEVDDRGNIIPYNSETLNSAASNLGGKYEICLLVKNLGKTDSDTTKVNYARTSSNYGLNNDTYNYVCKNSDGDFRNILHEEHPMIDVWLVGCFVLGNGEYWYAPVSEKYLEFKYYEETPTKREWSIVSSNTSSSSKYETFEPYINENVTLSATPIKSSGTCEVTVSGYIPDGVDASGVSYKFKLQSEDGLTISKEPVFKLNTAVEYKLSIEATTNSGATYAPGEVKIASATDNIKLNRTEREEYGSEGFVHYVEELNGRFELKDDVNPPIFVVKRDARHESNKDYETADKIYLPSSDADYSIPLDDTSAAELPLIPVALTSYYNEYKLIYSELMEHGTCGYAPAEDAIYRNDSGNAGVTCYFIPNSGSDITQCNSYTVEELQKSYSSLARTVEFDTAGHCYVPYSNLDEGFYTLAVVARDKNENYSVRCFPVLYRFVGESYVFTHTSKNRFELPSVTFEVPNNSEYSEYSEYPQQYYRSVILRDEKNSPENAPNIICKIFSNEKWSTPSDDSDGGLKYPSTATYKSDTELYEYTPYIDLQNSGSSDARWFKIYGARNDGTTSSGFYDIYYAYGGVDQSCSSKNFSEGVMGMQIYCDNSTFVHTIVSAKKITDSPTGRTQMKTNALKWEARGCEMSPRVFDVTGSSSVTYDYDPNDDESVPVGAYYTTIVHFADGTVAMGEVKQKK